MIQFSSITLNEQKHWVFSWVATGATYYRIILNGIQITATAGLTYTSDIFGYEDYPPPLEVVEETELALTEQHPPFMIMQWYAVSALAFNLYQYVSSTWAVIDLLRNEGLPVYSYQTLPLLDETTYQFQVTALDLLENESTPLQFQEYIVTPPVLVETKIAIAYNHGTGSAVISEVL